MAGSLWSTILWCLWTMGFLPPLSSAGLRLCVTALSVRGYCGIYVVYAYGIVCILKIPAGRLTPVLSVSVVSERHKNKTSLPGFVLLHRLR